MMKNIIKKCRFASLMVLVFTLNVANADIITYVKDDWASGIVNDGQTINWTYDFTELGFDTSTIFNSVYLNITANDVDANGDPVVIESTYNLGNLIPGSATTSFDLFGLTGTYGYLLDGMLDVSLTANEFSSYTETHYYSYSHRHYYSHQHCGWTGCYYETHYYTETHSNPYTETHYVSGSLELVSASLVMDIDDSAAHAASVPEPSALMLLALGLAMIGFTEYRRKKLFKA